MSAPTRQFQELFIDTQMPTTRRQAQSRSSQLAVDPEGTASSSGENSSSDDQAAPSTHSGQKSQASQAKGKQPGSFQSPVSATDTSQSPVRSRAYKTRDILSTFDPDKLPNDFRTDIFDRIETPRNLAACLMPLDLEGTIFKLAVADSAVYKSLSKVQPTHARAAHFFQKINRKIKDALVAFDRYAVDGTRPNGLLGPAPTVDVLANCLQHFLKVIRTEMAERHPHGGAHAAECLIYLLREVCNRNHDAFENNQWGRTADTDEDEDDRNLFQCLIGHASTGGEMFVLDALTMLPEAVSEPKREQLQEISSLLHRNRAPIAYRRAFQAAIDPVMRATSPVKGPKAGQKRPAAGSGGGGQKRTK